MHLNHKLHFHRCAGRAVIYSLMLTCRACEVEPLAWLRQVLTALPQRNPDDDISDLLPFNFKKKSAQTEQEWGQNAPQNFKCAEKCALTLDEEDG